MVRRYGYNFLFRWHHIDRKELKHFFLFFYLRHFRLIRQHKITNNLDNVFARTCFVHNLLQAIVLLLPQSLMSFPLPFRSIRKYQRKKNYRTQTNLSRLYYLPLITVLSKELPLWNIYHLFSNILFYNENRHLFEIQAESFFLGYTIKLLTLN